MSETLCPHCAEPICVSYVVDYLKPETITFCLQPHEGAYVRAQVLGRTIRHFGALLEASGMDSAGVKTEALITNISTDPDGTLKITAMCVPVKVRAAS